MAFVNAWVETDPDGSIIPVSLLDDSDRLIKGAVRERLEGDAANPNLTGLIEVGSFAAAPKPRKGTARLYVDTEANIRAYAAGNGIVEDGRFAIAIDSARLFHVATAGPVEIAYLPVAGGVVATGKIQYYPGTQVTNPARATGVIYSSATVSTGSAADVSLASVVIKAGTLIGTSDKLVITIHGSMIADAGNVNFKWGATQLASFSVTPDDFTIEIEICRTDATATHLWAVTRIYTTGGGLNYVTAAPADSSALDQTLDFRGSVTAGGTLAYREIQVETKSI